MRVAEIGIRPKIKAVQLKHKSERKKVGGLRAEGSERLLSGAWAGGLGRRGEGLCEPVAAKEIRLSLRFGTLGGLYRKVSTIAVGSLTPPT